MSLKNKAADWFNNETEHKNNVRLEHSETFEGPLLARKCTDLPCLIIYLFAAMITLIVTLYCYYEGDPERLVNPIDFRAELCGTGDLSDYKYGFFVNPTETSNVVLCLAGCPAAVLEDMLCLYEPDYSEIDYCYDSYISKPFHNRYCLPADEDLREPILEFIDAKYIEMSAGDVFRSWDVILTAIFCPLAIGMMYLVLIRFSCCMKIVSFFNIALFCVVMLYLGFLSYEEGVRQEERRCDDFNIVEMETCSHYRVRAMWESMAYVVGALGLIVVMVMLCMSSVLPQGVDMLRVASLPIQHAPSVLFLPVIGIVGGSLVVYVVWVLLTWGLSIVDINTEDEADIKGGEVKVMDFDLGVRGLVICCLVLCLWLLSSLASVVEMASNALASYWYFTLDKDDTPGIGKCLSLCISYHIGTIAAGSAILPVIKVPRSLLTASKSRLRDADSGFANCCVNVCYPCCVCHDDFLKYYTEKSYAYSVIWGSSFGEASKAVYFLIRRTGSRAPDLMLGGNIIVWICQTLIALSMPVVVGSWIMFQEQTVAGEYTHYISSLGWPCVFSLMVGAYISHCFGAVLRGLIHGITISYLCDSEMFKEKDRFVIEPIERLMANRLFTFEAAKIHPGKHTAHDMTFDIPIFERPKIRAPVQSPKVEDSPRRSSIKVIEESPRAPARPRQAPQPPIPSLAEYNKNKGDYRTFTFTEEQFRPPPREGKKLIVLDPEEDSKKDARMASDLEAFKKKFGFGRK